MDGRIRVAGRNAGGVAVRRPSAAWTGFNREEEVVVCSHRPWAVGCEEPLPSAIR